MKLYCMCEAQPGTPGAAKLDHQVYGAPNRYCAIESIDQAPDRYREVKHYPSVVPPLALRRPMVVVEIGVHQVILDSDGAKNGATSANLWKDEGRPSKYRVHYPNVDFLECPHCHTRVALESAVSRVAARTPQSLLGEVLNPTEAVVPQDLALTELVAWLGRDELAGALGATGAPRSASGEIGLKQAMVPAGMIPMVCVDRHRSKLETTHWPKAEAQARLHGQQIYLCRFALVEVIKATETPIPESKPTE